MRAAGMVLALVACAVAGCPNSVGTGSGAPDEEDQEHGSPGLSCEGDKDCDGFRDSEDPSPEDDTDPGNFSSLDSVLDDLRVKTALAELSRQGYGLIIHKGTAPTLVCGEFRWHDGHFVATGNGADVGTFLADSQAQQTPIGDDRMNSDGIIYWNGETLGTFSSIVNVQGIGDLTTSWSTGSDRCVQDGSSFTSYWISIESTTTVDGSEYDGGRLSLSVTVATRGEPTRICDERKPGDSEVVGGWAAILQPAPEQIGGCGGP